MKKREPKDKPVKAKPDDKKDYPIGRRFPRDLPPGSYVTRGQPGERR